MTSRHRAGIKAVHANGEPCPHRKGEPCPGREYRAQCKKPGCHFERQMDSKVQLEYVRDTGTCPTKALPPAPSASTTAPTARPPLKPLIRKSGPEVKPYRLFCPEKGCGRLGDYRNQAAASNAFGDHCDDVHPAPSPLELVRRSVVLREDGDGRWISVPLSGRSYTVHRADDGGYHVVLAGRGITVRDPLPSIARAQLCIAQHARVVVGCHAEAARLQLLREEKTTATA